MTIADTQSRLLHAAETLMLAKGYPATSVDEICESAGVSKGSFYHSFRSKEALGLALLEAVFDRNAVRMMDGPFRTVKDPVRRMAAFLDHVEAVSQEIWGQGCLLGSLGTELAETRPKIRAKVAQIFKKIVRNLAPFFEPAGSRNGRKGVPSPEELAEQFLVLLEGAIVMARVGRDWSVVTRSLHRFKQYLCLLAE